MNFDWTKPLLIDWTGRSGPLISEEDINSSVIHRILRNQFQAPYCEREIVKVKPWWSPRDPFGTISETSHTGKTKRFIPGLHQLPVYPQLSALNRKQHQQGLRVLSAAHDVQPRDYPHPTQKDYRLFEAIKEMYEKEQKEYIKWAKQTWINGDCIRALRPKPTVEQVYEAEFKMRALETQSLPQNYILAAQIPLETKTQAFEFEHKQDLIKVDIEDLPNVEYPEEMDRDYSILKPCPLPKPCAEHPCKFVLPYETSVSNQPMAEINYELAQYAIGNGVSFVASENALHCLLETERSWNIPVSVVEVVGPDGDVRNVTVLGSEFGAQKDCATQRTYKAYKHLLRHRFAPSTGHYKKKTSTQQTAESASPSFIEEPIAERLSSDDDSRLQIDDHEPKSDPNRLMAAECTDSEPDIYECDGELKESDGEPSSEPDRLMIDDNDVTITEPHCNQDYKPNYSKNIELGPIDSYNEHTNKADHILTEDNYINTIETSFNRDFYKPDYSIDAEAGPSAYTRSNEPHRDMLDNNNIFNQIPFYNKDSFEPDNSNDFKIRPSYSRSEPISQPDHFVIDGNDISNQNPLINQNSYEPDYSNITEATPSYSPNGSSSEDRLAINIFHENTTDTNLNYTQPDRSQPNIRLLEANEVAAPNLFETKEYAAPSLFEINKDTDPRLFETNKNGDPSLLKINEDAYPGLFETDTDPKFFDTNKNAATSLFETNEYAATFLFETEKDAEPRLFDMNNETSSSFLETNINEPTTQIKTSALHKVNSNEPVVSEVSSQNNSILSPNQLSPIKQCKESATNLSIDSINIANSSKATVSCTASVQQLNFESCSGKRNDSVNTKTIMDPVEDISEFTIKIPLKKYERRGRKKRSICGTSNVFDQANQKPSTSSNDADIIKPITTQKTKEVTLTQLSPLKPCIKKPDTSPRINSPRKLSFFEFTTSRLTHETDANSRQANKSELFYQEHNYCINQSENPRTIQKQSTTSDEGSNSSQLSPVKLTVDDTIEKSHCDKPRESSVSKVSFKVAIPTTHETNIEINDISTNRKQDIEDLRTNNTTKSKLTKTNRGRLSIRELFGDESDSDEPISSIANSGITFNKATYNNREGSASSSVKMLGFNNEPSIKDVDCTEDFTDPKNVSYIDPVSDKLSSIKRSPLKPILRKPSFSDSSTKNSKRKLSFSDPLTSDPEFMSFSEPDSEDPIVGFVNGAAVPLNQPKNDKNNQKETAICTYSLRSSSRRKPGTAAKKPKTTKSIKENSGFTKITLPNKQNKHLESFTTRRQRISAPLYNDESDDSDMSDNSKIWSRLISLDSNTGKTKQLTKTKNVGQGSRRISAHSYADSDDSDDSQRSRRISVVSIKGIPNMTLKQIGTVKRSRRISVRSYSDESDAPEYSQHPRISKPTKKTSKLIKTEDVSLRRSRRISSRLNTEDSDDSRVNRTKKNNTDALRRSRRLSTRSTKEYLPENSDDSRVNKTNKNNTDALRRSRRLSTRSTKENVAEYSDDSRIYKTKKNNTDALRRSRRLSTRSTKENVPEDSDDSQVYKTNKNNTDGLRRSRHLSTRSTKENIPPKTNQTKTNKNPLSLNTTNSIKKRQNRRKSLPANIFSCTVKLTQVIRSKSVSNLYEIANIKKIQRSDSKILSKTKSLNTRDTAISIAERKKRFLRRTFNSVCSETEQSEGEMSERTKRYIRRSISSAYSEAERSDTELKKRSKKYTRRTNSTSSYCARNLKNSKTGASSIESIHEDTAERTKRHVSRSISSAYSSCEEIDQPMPIRRKGTKRQPKKINTQIDRITNTMDSSSVMKTNQINQSNTIQFKTETMVTAENQVESTIHNVGQSLDENEIEKQEIEIKLYEEPDENIDGTETSQSTEPNLDPREESSLVTEEELIGNHQSTGNEIEEFNIFHLTASTETNVSGTESSDSENEIYIFSESDSNTFDSLNNLSKNSINETKDIAYVTTEIKESKTSHFSVPNKTEDKSYTTEVNRPRTEDVFFESANNFHTSNALFIEADYGMEDKDQTISNKVKQPVELILTDSALDFTNANVTDPNETIRSRKLSISETSDISDYYFDTNETEELNMFHFTATNNTDSEEESNGPSEDLDPPVVTRTEEEKLKAINRNDTNNKLNKTDSNKNEKFQSVKDSVFPSTSYRDRIPSNYETLDAATLSKEDINYIIGANNCTCKGTLFEVPPPRSFKKWQLRNITSNVNFNIIVHSSHKVRQDTREVLLEPIVEYQPELGGVKQSAGKIRALALSLMLRELAGLINVRIDHDNGNVIVVDRMSSKQFVARHGDRRGEVADSLHTALNQLRYLMPGQYVLTHESRHGSNAMLYTTKGAHCPGAPHTLSLRHDSINMTDAEEVIYAKIPPELGPALLPYHKHRSILPLAFTPFKSQVLEDKRAAAAPPRAKHPPSAIQWPKKKKSKKTRQRQSARLTRRVSGVSVD